ncbi:MAG: response regulator transcription factor [Saprospiraceae bacterium]|nr:response regulator transcription factor [Saprospiraceae bacterium]
MRILLVEDEAKLAHIIRLNLESEGYEVVEVAEGEIALQTSQEQYFDLILLDVMIPGINGFEVCKQIRLRNTSTPIIFLSARNTTDDRIQGLRLGADDYIVKPFNLEELLLRISIVLKRSQDASDTPDRFTWSSFWVDFSNYKAETLQGVVDLSAKETLLLRLLLENEGKAVSRAEILKAVWGYDVYPTTRTIDNFILQFRRYFEADHKNPKFFHSVRGVGYRFESSETNQ